MLQDGRLYVLDTDQKVHFERLKNQVPAPWDWAATQGSVLDQNVANIADPYVDNSNEAITSDISRDSFLPERLPEASSLVGYLVILIIRLILNQITSRLNYLQ